MSHAYRAVNWSPFKRRYDIVMALGIVAFLAIFVLVSKMLRPPEHQVSDAILVIRALGACGLTMLTITLCIGPLARLSPRFLPLLFNRRHLGVGICGVAMAHAALATVWYHGFGDANPLVSVLSSGAEYDSFAEFPFQPLGLAALMIIVVMAATSHDFWLATLGARVWKSIHMLVYLAYALLIGHVALGILQTGPEPIATVGTIASLLAVGSLHLVAGLRERRHDRDAAPAGTDGWVEVGEIDDIPMDAGKVVSLGGCRRVAVFRHADGVSALSNTCAHQGGPLGEGRIVDGCLTCPWHGYQYLVTDGQSPPPFTERIPTYEVRIEGRTVWLNPEAKEPGTRVPPAVAEAMEADS